MIIIKKMQPKIKATIEQNGNSNSILRSSWCHYETELAG
jgi:hypothetical protein